MALVTLKKPALSGGFQTIGTRAVKNLGWLFRHANQVTELYFKKLSDNHAHVDGYLLKAVMINGSVFESRYASRSVFADTFNRNRTLQGIAVFFDNEEVQAVGELTTLAHSEYADINDKHIHLGSRIEIPAYTDLWMRGARFGVVTRFNNTPTPQIKVCLDKLNKRYSFVAADCRLV